MYCPTCEKEVGEDARFCPCCGTRTTQRLLCKNCKTPLLPDMAFCPNCGTATGPPAASPISLQLWDTEEPDEIQVPDEPVNPVKTWKPDELQIQSEACRTDQLTNPSDVWITEKLRIPSEDWDNEDASPESSASGSSDTHSRQRMLWIVLGIIGAAAVILALGIAFLLKQPKSEKPNSALTAQSQETNTEGFSEETENSSEVSESSSEASEDSGEASESSDKASEGSSETSEDSGETSKGSGEISKNSVKISESSNAAEASPVIPAFAGAASREKQLAQVTEGMLLDESHLSNLLSNSGAVCGGYILDISNMEEYDCLNADASLPASALIGIPIMFTIADGMTDGSFTPETPVTFHYTFENGRGIMTAQEEGNSYTIIQLLGTALLYSDNNALNSLIDFLTLERINSTCHEYGYTSVDMQQKLTPQKLGTDNYLSARDAVLMLNAIYHNNFSVIGRSFLEEHFKMSGAASSSNGMYGACGLSETFLNLNGITDSRYNEIAIIENLGETFIICGLTSEGNPAVSAQSLSNLALYAVTVLEPLFTDDGFTEKISGEGSADAVSGDGITIYGDSPVSEEIDADSSVYSVMETAQDIIGTPSSDQDPGLLNPDLISEAEGIYVHKPGLGFMQAPSGRMWQFLDPKFKYYVKVCHTGLAAIDPQLSAIPTLSEGDELTIVCSNAENPVLLCPIVEDGYTIPVIFREDGILIWGDYEQGIQAIEEVIRDAADVNDQPYEDFFNTNVVNTVEEFFSESPTTYSTKDHLLRMQKGDTATVGYYEGTSYIANTYSADYHYFAYDYPQKKEYPITLTKEGYGVIDVSDLPNGFYLVQTYIGPSYAGCKDHYIIYIDR